MSEVLQARSALGNATRRGDDEAAKAARADLAAAKIAAYVEKALGEAPPLTDEQKDRLSSILTGALRSGGGAR